MSETPPAPPEQAPTGTRRRGDRLREGLLDDWVEVAPAAMDTLSGRMKLYAAWIVVAAISSIAYYTLTKDDTSAPESAVQAPVQAPDPAP